MPSIRDSANKPRGLPWRILICLALAMFVLRAAIPNGYMAAPSTTSLMLTLCEAGGAMNISFDLPGKSESPHAPSDACAFGALAGHAILPQASLTPVMVAQAAFAAPRIPVYHAAPALPPVSPPLGSRAPPSLYA